MALIVGVSCAAGVGRTCIRLGEGAAGSEPRGSGLRIGFWGFWGSEPGRALSQQGKDFFFSHPWPIDNT